MAKKKKQKPKKEKVKKAKKAKKINHSIQLRPAKKMDFMELDKYIKKDGKNVKSWKMIFGTPYWLINSKGEIENENYILSENTDIDDFAIYLMREQVLILIKYFE